MTALTSADRQPTQSFSLAKVDDGSERAVFSEFVAILLGIILLIAAVLKGHQLSLTLIISSISLNDVFSICVVAIELTLSFGLLFGQSTRLRFWGTVVFFLGAVLLSGAKAFSGEGSCGCFGIVKTSPWVSLGVAVSALLALFASMKGFRVNRSAGLRKSYLFSIGSGCIALGIIFGVAASRSGGNPVEWLGGDTVLFSNEDISFVIDPRDPCVRTVGVALRNTSLVRPISIVGFLGGNGDTVAEIPFSLAPGETRTVNATLRWPGFTLNRIELIYDAVRNGTAPFDQIQSPCTSEFRFVLSDGSVTRNHLTVSWCPSLEYVSELKEMSGLPPLSGK